MNFFQTILKLSTACLAEGYEKTDTPMIFSFTSIKHFDINHVNYRYGIELLSFDCIIHNDRNSHFPAMSKTNMN